MSGYIYILINASLPGLLKIGMTTRQPDDRARELSQGTGLPSPFLVAYAEEVPNSSAAESLIHTRLAHFRVQQGREFFNIPIRDAIREMIQIVAELRRFPPLEPSTAPLGGSETEEKIAISHAPVILPALPARNGEIVAVLTALRKNFQDVGHCYLEPDIPSKKRHNARERYSYLLQPGEEVVFVYDGTWNGSAKDGIIVTDRGLGWSWYGHSPNYCLFKLIKPDDVCNRWTGFFIQGGRVDVYNADRVKLATALKRSLWDLWHQRI